ncbi:sterol desaturase family protein [Chitinophaga agrisoli]|uniref:Sterol desaturase family protein n=1 Tax=Chitinophaga agrisoli TaxID=2607653 RepID=A0A5B2VP56_9BACT|nr:sterol desaturase family protein [Chitinophaga agrisoli]KAA2239859.1 sterol desaturase family protein [Chitinophaga agrisoli]
MSHLLDYLLHLPPALCWLIFLVENLMITGMVLFFGRLILRQYSIANAYTRSEIWIIGITNILNTVVTYAGYWLWKHGFITITTGLSWNILTDFLLLFFGMDLLMFVFHYIIHKTFLYKAIHQLHHQSVDPRPLDLFILHPLETLAFGGLWLVLLMFRGFNIYAIVIYLVINVVFGLAGHLGIEPLPASLRRLPLMKYIGTSTFHHDHHQDVGYNFGFYTSIWDRLMGTYKR